VQPLQERHVSSLSFGIRVFSILKIDQFDSQRYLLYFLFKAYSWSHDIVFIFPLPQGIRVAMTSTSRDLTEILRQGSDRPL